MLDPTPELSPLATDAAVATRLGARGLWSPAARVRRRGHPRLLGSAAQAALLGLVALSALLVLLTAAHSSFMTPTTNPRYFPAWMAGPLGGLWPSRSFSAQTMQALVAAILAAMYLAYLTAVGLGGRLRARWVIGAILAVHFAFVLAPPLQYTDVFNYINYGRMGVVHHLNPYTTVPILEPHGDPAFAISNWHWLVSPYGPLFTLFTYALVPLGVAGAFWALKLILCLSSLAVLALVWRSARMLGRDPVRAIALVGLNPIVLVWGLGADHNDILMMLPLTLGVYLLIRARAGAPRLRLPYMRSRVAHEYLAAAAFVAATGIKASAAVAIPIAFAVAPRRGAFAAGLALAATGLGLASVLAFGAHLPGISSQTQLVTGVGPANVLGWMLGQGGETDTLRTVLTVLAGAFVLCAAALASRAGRDWIALAGASLFVVWIATSWFAPWYIVWILPFAALAARGRLTVVVLAFGVYLLLAFGPEVTPLLHALHLNPFGSPLGQQHLRLNAHLVQ
ncbi:MAG: hypothetical protein ACLPUT_14740 [Solirubrobacteraceae bacterium]